MARPSLQLYLSGVVMRIPSYNTVPAEEDPWYWAYYGADLFSFSFYLDEYDVTGNATYLSIVRFDDVCDGCAIVVVIVVVVVVSLLSSLSHRHGVMLVSQSNSCKAKVPDNIVDEFLWRRSRNHNVSLAMLAQLDSQPSLFRRLYITLDDNAPYGLNIAESRELIQVVKNDSLQATVRIYPGADEVGLALLSSFSTDWVGKTPTVQLVYRDPTTINHIPNYEGQPMVQTLLDQVRLSCGADAM
jgi:hypothetical protein